MTAGPAMPTTPRSHERRRRTQKPTRTGSNLSHRPTLSRAASHLTHHSLTPKRPEDQKARSNECLVP